jgi:putative endonuclease
MSLVRGLQAEEQAAQYLKKQGILIVERNYRCKGGEIDLIAKQGKQIIFVEVRSRLSSEFGSAADSITHRKQQRIILAARRYLLSYPSVPICRFDAILFDAGKLTWLKNCFQA